MQMQMKIKYMFKAMLFLTLSKQFNSIKKCRCISILNHFILLFFLCAK